MENESAANQCDALLSALEEVNSDYQVLFTLPNSDTNGRVISAKVKDYVTSNPDRAFAVCSLGKRRYYSALKYASAVVGNSSSGIIDNSSLFFAIDYFVVDSLFYFTAFTALKDIESKNANNK